jgi:transcriptional regulator with XRE-family HTH domain
MTFQPRLQSLIREAFKTTELTDSEVARQLGCSTNWIKMFKSGAIKSPNVDRMEHLLFILTGESVEPMKVATSFRMYRADGSTYELDGEAVGFSPMTWTPVEIGLDGTISGRFESKAEAGE